VVGCSTARAKIVRFDDVDTLALSDHWPIAADFDLLVTPTKPRWDLETFASEIGRRHGPAAARAIDAIGDWAERKEHELQAAGERRWSLTRLPIPDAIEPECWLQLDLDGGQHIQYTISIKARGDVVVQFQYMALPPFDTQSRRAELVARLNEVEGINLNRSSGRPTFPIDVLADPARLDRILAALSWLIDETVEAATSAHLESNYVARKANTAPEDDSA
jgi:hypothetical protein